jgi:hypothetical protein
MSLNREPVEMVADIQVEDSDTSRVSKINDLIDVVRHKKIFSFTQIIDTTARDIMFLDTMGAYTIMVSGVPDTFPTLIAACCKSSSSAPGSVSSLCDQDGTGAWAGVALTITSTNSKFQIAHDGATSGEFNMVIAGIV